MLLRPPITYDILAFVSIAVREVMTLAVLVFSCIYLRNRCISLHSAHGEFLRESLSHQTHQGVFFCPVFNRSRKKSSRGRCCGDLYRTVQQSGLNSDLLTWRRQCRDLSPVLPGLRSGREHRWNPDRKCCQQRCRPQPGHRDLRSALYLLSSLRSREEEEPCCFRARMGGFGLGFR